MLFCAIVGLLAAGVDSSQGDAPRDTVALPSVISELRDGFRNCQFVAVQTKELTAPTKLKFKKESRAVGMICDNCCVLKIRIVMIERPNPNPATPGPVTKNSEFRFRSGQRVEEIKLRLDESQEWPSKESVDDRRQYESFTVLDPVHEIGESALDDLLIRDIAYTESNSGISLSDIAAEKHGFRLTRVKWESEDRSKISYHLSSPEYGKAVISCTMLDGRWMPTSVGVEKHPKDKMISVDRVPADLFGQNRAANFARMQGEFRAPVQAIDRIVRSYDIEYRKDGVTLRPEAITKAETIQRGNDQSTVTTQIRFDSFVSGGVSCELIEQTILRVPDGVQASILGDDRRRYVIKDNKVVPKVDAEGLAIAGNVDLLSPPRRFWGSAGFWLLNFTAIASIVVLLFWKRWKGRE